MQVLTEINHQHKDGRVVVVKSVRLGAAIKRLLVVFSFRAKIVDFVVWVVLFVKKPLDVLHVISIKALNSLGGESHSNYIR